MLETELQKSADMDGEANVRVLQYRAPDAVLCGKLARSDII